MPPTKSLIQIWIEKMKSFGKISKPIDFLKLIIGFIVIIVVAFLPAFVGILGANIEHSVTGKSVHEGNSIFGVLPWLSFFTVPIGFFLFIFWSFTSIKNTYEFFKKK